MRHAPVTKRSPRTQVVAAIVIVLTALALATGAVARGAAHAAAHPQARAHNRRTTGQRHRRDHKRAHHKRAHHKRAHHKRAHHKRAHHKKAHHKKAHHKKAHHKKAHHKRAHHKKAHHKKAHKTRHDKGKGQVKKPTTTPKASAARPSDPLAGQRFYVYPYDSAVQSYNTLVSQGDTSDAAQIAKVAGQPEAIWLTDDGSASVVPGIMSAAAGSGTEPVFVIYNIPDRDCSGGYSSGGASDASDYEAFVNSVVSGLGRGKVVVIVEPDALSNLGDGCLSSSSSRPTTS